MNTSLKKKYTKLKEHLLELEEVVIAYDGSMESTLLLKVAYDELGEEAIALMARPELMEEREFENVLFTAFEIGVTPVVLNVKEGSTSICEKIFDYMQDNELLHLIDNNCEKCRAIYNTSDNQELLEVMNPLKKIDITIDDIYSLSKDLGLPIWRNNYKPSPTKGMYSEDNSSDLLAHLKLAEEVLHSMNFTQFKIKLKKDTLKIEVNPNEVLRFYDDVTRKAVLSKMKELGFHHISVDMTNKKVSNKKVAMV